MHLIDEQAGLLERIEDMFRHEDHARLSAEFAHGAVRIELRLIGAERELINATYRKGQLKDDARRRVEREFDLREAHLASVGAQEQS